MYKMLTGNAQEIEIALNNVVGLYRVIGMTSIGVSHNVLISSEDSPPITEEAEVEDESRS